MESSDNTSPADIAALVQVLRETFDSKVTLTYEWRMVQLKKLLELVQDESLSQALYNDLHRSKFESHLLEINMIKDEIHCALNNLDKWMDITPTSTNMLNLPGSSWTRYDPLGVTLIMSPWNYPLLLTFQPLVGALAAGNTALLRPANYSANVSATIARLVQQHFGGVKRGLAVGCVLGDRDVTTAVLSHRFDYIFFTGGPQLGKIVLSKAAQFLTPCTLELGGKSPGLVDQSADLDIAAKRLAWSCFVNSAQTCVRPDYCFVHDDVKAEFIDKFKSYIIEFFTSPADDQDEYHILASALLSDKSDPTTTTTSTSNVDDKKSENSKLVKHNKQVLSESSTFTGGLNAFDVSYGTFESIGQTKEQGQNHPLYNVSKTPYFGRIVNEANFNRLVNCLRKDAEFVEFGGLIHPNTRFISPSVLVFPNLKSFSESESMKEELFGPLCPIVGFKTLDEPINYIRAHHKPLAAYCFTTCNETMRRVQTETSSGSLVFNDAIVQLSNHELPFGGVGNSGFGSYHGYHSFKTFSHHKAVLQKYNFCDIPARYPPYTTGKRRLLGFLGKVDSVVNFLGKLLMVCRRKLNKLHWTAQILFLLILLAGIVCGFGYLALPAIMKGLKNLVDGYYD